MNAFINIVFLFLRLLTILISVAISFSITSCSDKTATKSLKEADSVIETDSKKAFDILCAVDPATLSESDYPYYALLYTQAQIKMGILVDSDSLISSATRYYEDSNTVSYKLRSLFYNAKVLHNNRQFMESMKYALEAYELAKEHHLYYWAARSAELMSDIFLACYQYTQSEKYTLEAINFYSLANADSQRRYALCDLAIIYLNNNRHESAFQLLDSLNRAIRTEDPVDSELLDYLHTPLVYALMETNRVNKKEIADSLLAANPEAGDGFDRLMLKVDMTQADNNLPQTHIAISKSSNLASSPDDFVNINYARYCLLRAQKDFEKSANLADSILFYQDSIMQELINASIISTQRDFYSKQASIKKIEVEAERNKVYTSIILGICTVTILWWAYRYRMRKRKLALENAMAYLEEMKEEAAKSNSQNKYLENLLKEENQKYNQLKEDLDAKSKDLERKSSELTTISADLTKTSEELSRKSCMLEETYGRLETRSSQLLESSEELSLKSRELERTSDMLDIKSKELISTSEELTKLSKEYDKLSQQLDTLSSEMIIKVENEEKSQRLIQNLFQDQWAILNKLSFDYYEFGNSENGKKMILKAFEAEMKKLQSPKTQKNLEESIDTYFNGLMSLLKMECPFIKEKDLQLMAYLFAGFSGRTISLFTGMKYQQVYLRKSRLGNKILKSNAEHKDLFLERMKFRSSGNISPNASGL